MKTFKAWAAVLVLATTAAGCSARFNSAGDAGQGKLEEPPEPPIPPKPEPEWEGGFIQVACALAHRGAIFDYGRAGMMDADGREFQPETWKLEQFTDNDWFLVWARFPGHDPTAVPVPKPDWVQIDYYLFLRPSWDNPEQYYEFRDSFMMEFRDGETLDVNLPSTSARMRCRVQRP